MKKILSILMALVLTITLSAQKTQYYDLIIQKPTPLFHLYGSGAILNWNNGDILWTLTSNNLTMSGGNLLTSGTSAIGIGATTPLHQFVVASSITNGLNTFNLVNSTINKNRTTTTQARDSSSLNLWYTYTGSPLFTMTDKNGNVLFRADSIGFGIGTATPMTKFSVLTSTAVNNNAFNFTNSDINKTRTTFATGTDTSSVNLAFSITGSPRFRMIGKTGLNLFVVDSNNVGLGTSTPLHRLSVLSATGTNLNTFNFVNSTINKNLTSTTQATDTSSFNLGFGYTGSPTLKLTGKTANNLFSVDTNYVLTNGYVGIGTVSGSFTGVPQHKLEVATSSTTKLNAFNFVNTVNKRRDDPQQAADSSSFNLSFSTTGSPMLSLRNKAGANLLYIDSSKVTTTLDFAYGMKHAIGSADSIAYSTGTTQNWDYKINTTAFTWRENDGFTAAGDSIRILTAGDYEIHIWIGATSSNANDKLRVRLYANNARLASTSYGRMLINSDGSGNAETHYFMWYRECVANEYLSWRIANETGARASVISDIKVYVKKVPEN